MTSLDHTEAKASPSPPDGADVAGARAERALLRVDHDAIRHNVARLRELASGARIMGVVKGDAYGLGAVPVARTLRACGVPAFCVDSVAEGLELRAAGFDEPIMVIDGDLPQNADAAVRWNLLPGIPDHGLLDAYARAARRAGARHRVWLVANVGFNRTGYRAAPDFRDLVRAAAESPELEVGCVCAHMTNAHSDEDVSRVQIARFVELCAEARSVLGPELKTSLFASHGIPRWSSDFPTDWVRPGLFLYGEHMYSGDGVGSEALGRVERLRPALELRARVSHVISFDADDRVGYGHVHAVRAGQRLATLTFGFGRGFPPGTSRASVLLRGRRRPVVGAVGLDAMQVDVIEPPPVRVGDWAVLAGRADGDRIRVSELARACGVSPYELLTRLSCRTVHDGLPSQDSSA